MRIIDADALKEAIKNDIYVVDYGVEGAIYGMFWSGIENAIDEQPTVEPKTGKWAYKITDAYIQRTCSACGWSERMYHRNRNQDGLIRNYCPNCGSRNGGGDD